MPEVSRIRDLKRDGLVRGRFLIVESQLRTARNGKSFIAAVIGDSTGQMALKVWGGDAALAASMAAGQVIELSGVPVKEFNKVLQIEFEAAHADLFAIDCPGPADMSKLLPATPFDREALWNEVRRSIEQVRNPSLHALLVSLFSDECLGPVFREVPAATRRHHAYVGGLMEHTARVTGMCQCAARLYPGVDSDLLITGALLHDIGKVKTYTVQAGFDLTEDGRFFGHLMIGVQLVEKEIARLREQGGVPFDEVLQKKLLHMLLSHHGIMEWGSPVEPLIIEACILHHADNMDAQAAKFVAASFSEKRTGWVYDPALGRTILVDGPVENESAAASE